MIKQNKAIFLDRDGVINIDYGYVYKWENFKFCEGIFKFCNYLQKRGFLLIVVTNQSGIARGKYSEEDFLKLNEKMIETFKKNNVEITKVYYCPFYEKGIVEKYKKKSIFRKPNPGMIDLAVKEFNIDLKKSFLIGNEITDLKLGENTNLSTIIISSKKMFTEKIKFWQFDKIKQIDKTIFN